MSQGEFRPARGRHLSRLVGRPWLDRRAGSRSQQRRRRAALRLGLDQLEVRTLLSNTAAPITWLPPTGSLPPVTSETTWNLQLQPGGAGALSTLVPAIAAAGTSIGATRVHGLYVVQGPAAAMASLGARLAATPGVAYAAPQRILSIAATPNDPNYTNGSQWQLNGNWGIQAPGAWDVTIGSNSVIVADVDTGLNYNLADMNYNVWLNQAEIPSGVKPNLTDVNMDGFFTFSDLNNAVNQGSGKIVDTNNDGVITGTDVLASTSAGGWASGSTQDGATGNPDDLIGWNYAATGSNGITGTNNPQDDNGHGTFTAGEIAAVGNNALGVTGVEWNAQLMPVKFLDSTGSGTDTAADAALHYAVDHGAKVINASWGANGADSVIQDGLVYANQHGVIVVCAAGNNGANDDTTFFAPASYSVQDPNVISVAAIGSSGTLAPWSNYGTNSVQLAAPGVGVYSLASSGSDGTLSGTSMAAPLVTGTIALVRSAHPTWSMSQVIDAVLDHTTPDSNVAGKVKTGGIVNATAAVANTDGPHVVASTTVGSVSTAGGLSGVQVTFNEEVNPSTFTSAQATLTGPNGAISGLTVSVVSGSNDHQFLISFPGQTTPGTYTLTVGPAIQDWYGNAMNQNRNGVNGEASDAFTTAIQETNTTATFLKSDATTQGSWKGVYGADGYSILENASSYPSYATVGPSGQIDCTWVGSTTDVRALQKATTGATDRIAACWYSGSQFSVDVNLTDGKTHEVSLYAQDWDSTTRAETVQVVDAATNTVLDTETLSSFHNGTYLSWNIRGHIVFRFINTGPTNAVVSGLFFGGSYSPSATATFLSSDKTTQGSWKGVYGADGYSILENASSDPSYATVTPSGQIDCTWAGSTTDVRALQKATTGATDRIAACWYAGSQFSVDVNLTDGKTHEVSLYGLDWDSTTRAETVQVVDATTGIVLDTETLSSFHNGTYLSWNISGHIVFKFTNTGPTNAVVSGLFFGGSYSPSAKATFLSSDTTTQGSWKGVYGADGYNILENASSYPSYATVTPSGQIDCTWAGSTTDVRALQKATTGATDRIAACWYAGSQFTVDVNLTDGKTHEVSLYALDWDSTTRAETVQVIDAATNTVLDTETLSSFHNGTYLSWNISGHIVFRFVNTGPTNAVVSGLFFGGSYSSSAKATFLSSDTTTQGSWKGVYGADGYNILENASSYPAYATVTPSGQIDCTWAGSTTDVRALQKAATGATDRIAACWYASSQFSVDVNLTDGNTHKVSLYALDWDSTTRAETVQVVDAATGIVLDTETLSSFHNGTYLSWNISGHIVFKFTNTGPTNAVVSGLFFG
jgi:subtilisin family serine protease